MSSVQMGSGASVGINAAVNATKSEDLTAALLALDDNSRARITEALTPRAKNFTLIYHGGMQKFLGRGWAPMMILEEGGATYECKTPDAKPPVTFAPPMIITPGGAEVSQVSVVAMTLGKELGLWPAGAADIKAMQFCCDAADMLSDSFAKKGAERLGKWMAHFEGQMDASGGTFLFGSKVTAADYVLFVSLVMSGDDGTAELKKYSKLSAFVSEMKKQKGYKAVEAKGIPVMN